MENNNNNQSTKLKMSDILVANASLKAFDIIENEEIKKFIEEVKKKQEKILKLKEVNDEQLRKVVMR